MVWNYPPLHPFSWVCRAVFTWQPALTQVLLQAGHLRLFVRFQTFHDLPIDSLPIDRQNLCRTSISCPQKSAELNAWDIYSKISRTSDKPVWFCWCPTLCGLFWELHYQETIWNSQINPRSKKRVLAHKAKGPESPSRYFGSICETLPHATKEFTP